MKRSEMIKLIEDKFSSLDIKENAERILDVIENAGMEPPIVKHPDIPKDMNIFKFTAQKTFDSLHKRKSELPEEYYINAWDKE